MHQQKAGKKRTANMDVNYAGFKVLKNSVLQMFGWETPKLNRVVFIYEKTPQDTFKTTYIYIFLTSDLMWLCEWRLSSLGGRGGGCETLTHATAEKSSQGGQGGFTYRMTSTAETATHVLPAGNSHVWFLLNMTAIFL